ncbi:hypothetical protein Tco_0493081, partial [Tanacetum coccineum]
MDGVLSQAQETLGTLMFQRSTFGGINSKLSNVGSRFPIVRLLWWGELLRLQQGTMHRHEILHLWRSYELEKSLFDVRSATAVPWTNERPLENKELNAIIGAWFTLWRD